MTYLKLVPPALGVLITMLISAFSDGHVTTIEWLQISVAVVQTAAVGLGGLLKAGVVWPKTTLAGVLAALQLVLTYVTADGSLSAITLSEWLNVLMSVLVVFGVAIVPPRSGRPAPAVP